MDLSITCGVDARGRDRMTLVGAIDLASRDEFLRTGRALLRDGAVTVAIDLAGITFLDSTGIGSLVELTRDAEDIGASIVLTDPSERVRRLLEITGLSDAWQTETSAKPDS